MTLPLPKSERNCGFTLVELLVALGVGMYLISLAFVSLSFITKAVKRNESMQARTDAAQQLLLSALQYRTSPIPIQGNRTGSFFAPTNLLLTSTTNSVILRAFVVSQTTNATYSGGGTITTTQPTELFFGQRVMHWDSANTGIWLSGTITSQTNTRVFALTTSETVGAAPSAPPATRTTGGYDMLYAPTFYK